MAGYTNVNPIAAAIRNIMQAKRQRQQDEQIRQMVPGSGGAGPTGIAGVFDRLNPFSPARGATPLDRLSAQKQVESQFKQPYGKPPWYTSPKYGGSEAGQIAAGLKPRAGRPAPARTAADVIEEIVNLNKARQYAPEGSVPEQAIDNQLKQLEAELAELQGMGIEEVPGTPGTPASGQWNPFKEDVEAVAEVPASRKLVPKTAGVTKVPPGLQSVAKKQFAPEKQMPAKSKGKKGTQDERVTVISPTGEVGTIPKAQLPDAQKQGYKIAPQNLESQMDVPTRAGTRLPFDKGYAGTTRAGTRLPQDKGYTGATRPGTRLPFDKGYEATAPRPAQRGAGKWQGGAFEPGGIIGPMSDSAGIGKIAGGATSSERSSGKMFPNIPEQAPGSTGVFEILNPNAGFSITEPEFRRTTGEPGSLAGVRESAAQIAELFKTQSPSELIGPLLSEDEIADLLYEKVYQEEKSRMFGEIGHSRRKSRTFGSESLSPMEQAMLRADSSHNIPIRPR